VATVLLVIIIAVLPVVVHYKSFTLKGSQLLYIPANNGSFNDLSMYYKSCLLIAAVLCLFLYFCGERVFPDKKVASPLIQEKSNRIFILLSFVFIILALLSLSLSQYADSAWNGVSNSFEGTPVLIGYLLLFLLSINYFSDSFNIHAVLRALPFLFGFLIVFGLVEVFYKTPFDIPALQYLVLPPSTWKSVGGFAASQYKGRISLTFANPDYAGEFLVLVLPLSFYLIKKSTGKRRIIPIVISSGLLFLLVCSGSRTAFAAFALSILILAVIFRKALLKAWKPILSVIAILIVLSSIAVATNNLKLPSLGSAGKATADVFHVDDMKIDGQKVYLKNQNHSFVIECVNKDLIFYDENNKQVTPVTNGSTFTFDDERYKAIKVTKQDDAFFVNMGYDAPVEFVYQQGKVYAVGTNGSLLGNVSDDSGFGFKNLQFLATGRGYIWRKSIPLLKNTIFLGVGADCSTFFIPQNDFAGKLNYQGSANLVIDKPHSQYLQTAINTGVLSLAALIAIFFLYFKKAFRALRKGDAAKHDLSAAIFAGVAGYLLCGFFYDSSITVAPVFWLLLGLGVALCNTGREVISTVHHINTKNKKEKVK
jgi:O-antigen ligase